MKELGGERRFSPERSGKGVLKNIPAGVSFPSWDELPSEDMRRSAVLVPLFPSGDALRILFLRRSPHLSRHGGEICFPGGMKDADDLSPLHTALRETEEETGIPGEAVEPLLLLSPEYTVVSDVEVFPVLGIVSGVDPERELTLSPSEIIASYSVDIALFPAKPRRKEILFPSFTKGMRENREHAISYPEYDLPDGSVVWGVTARILEKVCCLL